MADQRSLNRKIKVQEEELSQLRRKVSVLESDKARLSEENNRYKQADSWARRSPKKPIAAIGALQNEN